MRSTSRIEHSLTSIIGLAALLLAGSIFLTDKLAALDSSPRIGVVHAEEVLPASSIRDLRTFSDFLVVVDVVGESNGVSSGGRGRDGYIPRTITVDAVRTEWTRMKNTRLTRSFELMVAGSVAHEGSTIPVSVNGCARPELGKRYAVFMSVYGPDSIEQTSPCAFLELDASSHIRFDTRFNAPVPLKTFEGRMTTDLAHELSLSLPYIDDRDLPAEARLALVRGK